MCFPFFKCLFSAASVCATFNNQIVPVQTNLPCFYQHLRTAPTRLFSVSSHFALFRIRSAPNTEWLISDNHSNSTDPCKWTSCRETLSGKLNENIVKLSSASRSTCDGREVEITPPTLSVCVCVCVNAASSRRVTVAKPPPTQFSRSIELSIWNINNFFSYGNVFLNKTHRNKVLHPNHLDWQDYKTLSHVSHVWVSLLCLKSQSHLLALPRTCAWLGSAPEIFISMTT